MKTLIGWRVRAFPWPSVLSAHSKDLKRGGFKSVLWASAGDLSDCRKLYFGLGPSLDSHRIVCKRRPNGDVEVLEIVAVETRGQSYAHLLAAQRLGRLPESRRWWLSRVAARLGRSDPAHKTEREGRSLAGCGRVGQEGL